MTTTDIIFEKRKTTTKGGLDALFTVFRHQKPNFIGMVGKVAGHNEWLACLPTGHSHTGFKTRKAAAEFLSVRCGPFKSEVKAALKALEAEMSHPLFQAALAKEI